MPDQTADSGSAAPSAKPRAKPPSPWSVRGVSREARAKASKAASRRRETIGEWVTNALTQVANEELGTGPRRAQTQDAPGGLPAGPLQDESPLGKALLALAERFERSEKRNEAIVSLAERMEGGVYGGGEVSVMAEQIGIVEQRSRALTLLVERLESAEKRENSLLTLMHSVAERAERGEERIAAVTRGLADLALGLETALSRNSSQTAQRISNSMAPIEDAVNALGSRLSTPPPQASGAPAGGRYYGDSAGTGDAPSARQPNGTAPDASAPESGAEDGQTETKRLKFDFNALNESAIKNSQRLAHDLEMDGVEEKEKSGGWFGKKPDGQANDADSKQGDDWAHEYMVEDGAGDSPAGQPQEPTLDQAGAPAPEVKPALSEEDEMLSALKQAIKPEKP